MIIHACQVSPTLITSDLNQPLSKQYNGYVEWLPYYRKLTLREINVLEINANFMENDFRIKKINAKEEVEFHKKEINAIILTEIKGEDIDITSDRDNDEDELEIL